MRRAGGLLGAFLLGVSVSAVSAAPFTVTAQLTGDPRLANPDGLLVDITITGDTTTSAVQWLVDLNSAAHPNVKLDALYFNVAGSGTDYSFSSFNPSGWGASTPANNAAGSGGMDFLFRVGDLPGPPNNNVTNSVNLSFTMTKLTGPFSPSDFLLAPGSTSNDAVLGGPWQLGAHLQSLSGLPGQATSGFAVGQFRDPGQPVVPEPLTLLLVGLGLGAVSRRLRRSA